MRLFTAIDLPAEMLEKLSEFPERLRPLAKLHWSPMENLHITTKFIGEWPEGRFEEMKKELGSVKIASPIRISVRGVGSFPRAFWAGVDGGEPLANLARATDDAVERLGVAVEKRPYTPHLTLARAKTASLPLNALRAAAGEPDFGSFNAASFFLYLSKSGKYSKLAGFPLHS
jgi:2'-5' RNA ligase